MKEGLAIDQSNMKVGIYTIAENWNSIIPFTRALIFYI